MAQVPRVGEEQIATMGRMLADRTLPVSKRFRLIFTLKNLGGDRAVDALITGFADDSALLKHEIAFVLGQMQSRHAIPALTKVLRDLKEDSMAGEALGAIAAPESLDVLREYAKDPLREVAETCALAVDRILWAQEQSAGPVDEQGLPTNPYHSVDPAPPAKEKSVAKLRAKLLDSTASMFDRYRALFTLRNIGGKEAIDAMAAGFADTSALLRHEIAFVMGQMQEPLAIEALSRALAAGDEHPMVRHEAAEALGAIANDKTLPLMKQYAVDKERVVRESCEVALDVAEYMTSDVFQYADGLQQVKSP